MIVNGKKGYGRMNSFGVTIICFLTIEEPCQWCRAEREVAVLYYTDVVTWKAGILVDSDNDG